MFANPTANCAWGSGCLFTGRLLAVLSSIVFKSQPECALGAPWGGAGAQVCGGGRRAASRRRSNFPNGSGSRASNNKHL